MEEQQAKLKQQASELDCFSKLVVAMAGMKYGLSKADRVLFQACLCPEIRDGSEQGWEETVNGAVMYLLKTSLAKNVKESASLTGTTLEVFVRKQCAVLCLISAERCFLLFQIGTTIEPLKKHLQLVLDRLEKGGKISLPPSAAASNSSNSPNAASAAAHQQAQHK